MMVAVSCHSVTIAALDLRSSRETRPRNDGGESESEGEGGGEERGWVALQSALAL